MKTKLFLLPGFLGEPSDFNGLIHELRQRKSEERLQIEILDWMNFSPDPTSQTLTAMGEILANQVTQNLADKNLVLGYSLGGRLSLALREALGPDSKFRFLFVSTNPGLATAAERVERKHNDSRWAERFRTEEWDSLLVSWNQQGVFQGSKQEPDRTNLSSQREVLARVLENWSLAEQKNYRPSLKGDDFIWITGGLDEKFTSLAEGIPNSRTIPSASHRVHLDAPSELAEMVLKFIP